MRYDISDELREDMRSASADLAVYSRRFGKSDERTKRARRNYDRLRAIALIATADKYMYALGAEDAYHMCERINDVWDDGLDNLPRTREEETRRRRLTALSAWEDACENLEALTNEDLDKIMKSTASLLSYRTGECV